MAHGFPGFCEKVVVFWPAFFSAGLGSAKTFRDGIRSDEAEHIQEKSALFAGRTAVSGACSATIGDAGGVIGLGHDNYTSRDGKDRWFAGCELLKQESLGRVRTPLEKREAIVRAFEAAGMSAAWFARHHGLNYSTFCSWVKEVRRHGQAERQDVSEGVPSVRWLEAVVEGESVVREEPSALCVEWHSARWKVCSQSNWGSVFIFFDFLLALRF